MFMYKNVIKYKMFMYKNVIKYKNVQKNVT